MRAGQLRPLGPAHQTSALITGHHPGTHQEWIMIAHGLQLEVQVLAAKEYFEWLGVRQNTYQAQQDYPGGRHVSGDEAKALLGIK